MPTLPNHLAQTPIGRKWAEEYEAGASIRQIAKAHSSNYTTVHRTLMAAGVTFRGRGGRKKDSK